MSIKSLLGAGGSVPGENWTITRGSLVDYYGYMKYSSTAGLWAAGSGNLGTRHVSFSSDGINWVPRVIKPSLLFDNGPGVLVWAGSRLIVGTFDGAIFTCDDTVNFVKRRSENNAVDSIGFTGMAWNGSSTVVAVGYASILYSTDNGVTWTKATDNYFGTANNTHFNGVAWNGSRFVAWGVGGLATSTDGITWTFRQGQVSTYGIAYSSSLGIHVAVGALGYNATSSNGNTWVASTPPTTADYYGIHWSTTHQRFIATATGGGISTSTNGTSWTNRTSGTTNQLWGAASNTNAGSPVYVVVGGLGTILSSTDLATWTSRTSNMGTSLLTSCVWSGSQFIAVGGSTNITKSTDGATWTAQTGVFVSATYYGIAHNGSLFVVVGQGGRIYTSPDGTTWTLRTSGTTNTLRAVVWTGSSWIVTSDNGRIFTSTDGTTWTEQTSNNRTGLRAVSSSGTSHIAVGYGEILVSTNLTTWTARATGFTGEVYYDSTSGYVFAGDGNGVNITPGSLGIMRSADGITWERLPVTASPDDMYDTMWRFTRTGSTLWGFSEAGDYLVKSTDNGATWSGKYLNSYNTPRGIIFTGGVYYLYGESDLHATSTDGSTWTEQSLSTKEYPGSRSITYSPTLNLYAKVDTVGNIDTSTNGINWTRRNNDASPQFITNNGPQFLATGSSGYIRTSSDGITWSTRTSGTTQSISGAAWTGSRWIAACSHFSGAAAVSLTSTDGVTWSAGGFTGLVFVNRVIWAPSAGLAIACSQSATITTSPDGTTWTTRTAGITGTVYGGAANSSIVVLVSGSDIISSTNGIDWTTRATFSAGLSGVIWTGNYFIAFGTESVAYSRDGINWTNKSLNWKGDSTNNAVAGPRLIAFNSDATFISP